MGRGGRRRSEAERNIVVAVTRTTGQKAEASCLKQSVHCVCRSASLCRVSATEAGAKANMYSKVGVVCAVPAAAWIFFFFFFFFFGAGSYAPGEFS